MRPSELRRRERRSWLGFAAICLGCVLLVFVAAETSERFFEPRWSPDDQPAMVDEPTDEETDAEPERVVAALARSITEQATAVRELLGKSRSVQIEGAVVFLTGGLELGDFVERAPDGRERLLLVTWRATGANSNDGAVRLTVYQRTGNTWQAFDELFELPYDLGDRRTDSPLTAAGVTIRKAGEGVLAVDIPRRSKCDPSVTSDLERVRTVYVELFDKPTVVFEHGSSGVRGNEPDERLRVQLTFSQRTREQAAGEMTIVRRYADVAFPATWELPFSMRGGAFTLDGNPTAFLSTANRTLNEAIRNGDSDAERDARRLIEVLRLVGKLDGKADFCVAMPHRVLAPDTLDRERWQDRLDEHIFDIQLRLAGLLAGQGRGMQALDVFGLDDPGLILNSSARRRELLDSLTGPRLATLRYFPEMELELRPRAFTLDSSTAVSMPLVWLSDREVIVPVASSDAKNTRSVDDLRRALGPLAGALRGARAGASGDVPLDPGRPSARGFVAGAVRGTLSMRTFGSPADEAADVAWNVRRSALERIDAIADVDGLYTGHRYPVLDVVAGTISRTATWAELQALHATDVEWDRLPDGLVVVRSGISCGGGFVQYCTDRCDAATLPVPDPDVDGDVGTVLFPVPGRDVAPCYPAETPGQTGELPFVGWDGDAVVLRDQNRWLRVERLPDAAEVQVTRPVFPKVGSTDSQIPIVPGWPWLHPEPGLAERFQVAVDGHALWLHDLDSDRDYLLNWWNSMPLGPPEDEVFTASVAPDGRHVVLWIRGEGTWLGQLSDLPSGPLPPAP